MTARGSLLEVSELGKRYDARRGDGQQPAALYGVDLQAAPGELVSVIGPSGAGKSTLLRCINRLIEPSAGRVRFGGEDITHLRRGKLRPIHRQIAMIFQNYNLVYRMADADASERRDADVSLPKVLDYLRSLDMVRRPRLLLLDEPTASLDNASKVKVRTLIEQLKASGTTMLGIFHDLEFMSTTLDTAKLAAGSYTLSYAVVDDTSDKTGTATRGLTLNAASTGGSTGGGTGGTSNDNGGSTGGTSNGGGTGSTGSTGNGGTSQEAGSRTGRLPSTGDATSVIGLASALIGGAGAVGASAYAHHHTGAQEVSNALDEDADCED